MSTTHKWKFFRAGGFDQVKLESGADIAHLAELDQKLWVALACPTTGLEFDSKTLALLDTDKDGRIRVPEIIAAAQWTTSLLKNPDDLLKGAPALPLAAINDSTPEGKQILASAKQTLVNLGKADATAIDLSDTADTAKILTVMASSPPMPPPMISPKPSSRTSSPALASRPTAAANPAPAR